MKERLVIISDLWGSEKAEWLPNYTEILETKFELWFYDSCEIGKVDKSNYEQYNLHIQFVDGGIDLAVDNLVEKERNPVNILAFSVGGVIAWKFGLSTDNIKSLLCVSSARLRKETERPKGRIELYFGEKDEHLPSTEWRKNMQIKFNMLIDKGHMVYTETEFARNLSEKMLETSPQQYL
ncbi:MAG: alpha/beta hydrolase [Bacteroidota bacterium]